MVAGPDPAASVPAVGVAMLPLPAQALDQLAELAAVTPVGAVAKRTASTVAPHLTRTASKMRHVLADLARRP